MSPRRCAAAMTLAALVLLPAPAALARGGGDDGGRAEARAAGACAGGGRWEVRARAEDGVIALELRASEARFRGRSAWRVVVVHERRLAWRGTVRVSGGGGLRLRRALPDYPGPDAVTVRASTAGTACQADVELGGS